MPPVDTAPVRLAVYSPANLNAIDGSSIWTQTVSLAFARIPGVKVSVVLTHPITNDRILGPLIDHPHIDVIDPMTERLISPSRPSLSVDKAARFLARLAKSGHQVFVVRGLTAASRLAAERQFRGKLLPYLTDIPQRADDMTDEVVRVLDRIMAVSPALLCQTPELLAFLESQIPSVAGKGWLLPPIIPDEVMANRLAAPTANDLRLCYAGKYARMWKSLEMCDLPAELAARGITAELTMVGDKINRDDAHPDFVAEMTRKLESSPGVRWAGGVSRQRSIELISAAHVGLSWRSPEMDDSLELSTKLLEYCAAGTPPVLNRTAMHERIFGADYPLFVGPGISVLDILETTTTEAHIYEMALDAVSDVAAGYTMEKAGKRLWQLIESLGLSYTPHRSGAGPSVRSVTTKPRGG